ncbi:hypothetical protein [Sulfitobacter sp. PS-8MA]|uniref:hypothetical protein n=1 Tax=Sulfitobacter sp. PS-8MA TaxID=3237707 RepID=UPI0034C658DD
MDVWKAKVDLDRTFQEAYRARGIYRAKLFFWLATGGAWYGLFSWWAAIKLLIIGGAFGRPVQF